MPEGDPNGIDEETSYTLAMQQVRTGNMPGLRGVITAKADLSRRDRLAGYTALHHAVATGSVDAVGLLLEAGAPLHAVDADGLTAFQLAFVAKQPSCAAAIKAAYNACLDIPLPPCLRTLVRHNTQAGPLHRSFGMLSGT